MLLDKLNKVDASLIGQIGLSVTELYDSDILGKVSLNGKTYSACSSYEYIPEDREVEILEISGNSLVVKPC